LAIVSFKALQRELKSTMADDASTTEQVVEAVAEAVNGTAKVLFLSVACVHPSL